jgi:hypothetical protein
MFMNQHITSCGLVALGKRGSLRSADLRKARLDIHTIGALGSCQGLESLNLKGASFEGEHQWMEEARTQWLNQAPSSRHASA